MTIESFEINDNGWILNRTSFGPLSLLVGVSGVGKTKIIKAIEKICKAAVNGADHAAGCSWKISLQIDGHEYYWEGVLDDFGDHFESEKIILDGYRLVNRNYITGEFLYKDNKLPKLKWTESAISLLRDEADIAPLTQSLNQIIISDNNFYFINTIDNSYFYLDNMTSLDDLQKAPHMHLLVKIWTLQEKFKNDFENIKLKFKEIFPFTENIKIRAFKGNSTQSGISYILFITEKETKKEIPGPNLSTGMLKTLKILFELSLAPKGTLFLIDEFENSLGINCLPQIAETINERQGDIQFILTSHHPYVINNINWKNWKLVTRHGSTVTVHDASDIPALNTASTIDRFELLVNSPEYEDGIA
ncbi:MAG: ATP-binding protein [Magnetococcales bacterium]|nr:ATP-binding protein [Magnetococcales bacterium]